MGGDPRNGMSSPANLRETSTPPPPGFMPSSLPPSPAGNNGEPGTASVVNYYDGEALRGEGTYSAPPPPGFNSGSHDERVRIANHAIWNDPRAGGEQTNWTLDTRTTSFSNLAAMVGTGLAESMEDSTQDARRDGMLYDLSYARQTRHAASRLLGSSGCSPTAALLDLTIPGHAQKRLSSESAIFPNSQTAAGNRREAPATLPSFAPDSDPGVDFRASVQHRNQQPQLGIFNNITEVGMTVMEPDMGRNSAPPQLFGETLSRQGTPVLDELQRGMHSRQGTPVLDELQRGMNSRQGTPVLDELQRGMNSRQGTPVIDELQRGMQTMSMENRSVHSSGDVSQHSASEAELEPFLWDVHYAEPSRALAILRTGTMLMSDLRSTCEAFGVLEVFRADFADRGIVFVGYYDIRSAEYAAQELKQALRRLSSFDVDVEVAYCVPLNSSSTHDESVIVLSDLPHNVGEHDLMSMLSSYGSVRSLQLQAGAHYGGKSYMVEFHNVQDAKLALLELDSSQPWGQNVMVEVGTRRAVDRRRGRELLGVIGKWRHGTRQVNQPSNHQTNGHNFASSVHTGQAGYGGPPGVALRQNPQSRRSSDRSDSPSLATQAPYSTNVRSESDGTASSTMPQQTTQLVLGPDGRYSYVIVNQAAFHHRQAPQPTHHHVNPHGGVRVLQPQVAQQQQVVQGPHGTYYTTVPASQPHVNQAYWNHAPPHQQYQNVGGPSVVSNGSYAVNGAVYTQSEPSHAVPYYAHVITNQENSSVSSGSGSGGNPNGVGTNGAGALRRPMEQPEVKCDNRHLTLDIDSVQAGRDARTSLMVRNIPNKYTQQMLLSEFTENGHGPGKIDFFYLPIDFKNKCNRGYAFVNFVDFKDIVTFHRQYFGQHWRVFNSDKICDITYARIQGKASMLKRFENSALMEKDEEYKPLVFVSHGSDKGKRLPFPSDTTR